MRLPRGNSDAVKRIRPKAKKKNRRGDIDNWGAEPRGKKVRATRQDRSLGEHRETGRRLKQENSNSLENRARENLPGQFPGGGRERFNTWAEGNHDAEAKGEPASKSRREDWNTAKDMRTRK